MSRLLKILAITLIFFSASCRKNNPCDRLVDGVYVYPEIPEDHNWTKEQVAEYINIPNDILDCITTPGLIESTMNYPYLSLIDAGANPQSGYDNLVKRQYRGMGELENRTDAAKYLLERYERMEPGDLNPRWTPLEKGGFMFDFFYTEVIFSQFVILEKLQPSEKIALVEEVIEKFYLKTGECCENDWSIYSAMMGTIISARLMYMDEFQEFMDLWWSSDGVGEFTMFISPTFTYEEGEQILTITQNYLNHLKTQNQ